MLCVARLCIGTSGFSYKHWENDVFYPKGLSRTEQLSFYTKHFDTVELNNTFYRLPNEQIFGKWRESVPKGFVFAVKVSRFLTHRKRLKDAQESWELFLSRARTLEETLGPFLFQFPANWKKNKKRFQKFLTLLAQTAPQYFYAFEFRHESWFSEDVYKLFAQNKKLNLAFVRAYSSGWPLVQEVFGRFVYIRLHGSTELYSSNYSIKELKNLAENVSSYLRKDLNTFVYFNNDARGFAIKNASYLKRMFI